jgi:hypothetical protein
VTSLQDGAAPRRVTTHALLRLGLPRDPRATRHLGTFLVATAATVLLTRAFLAATGYPQVGGDGLHIAHVLWGGLLMALAFVLLLSFAGPALRPLGSLVGGVGFGLFVDEVGKFVTSDNDYFYEPTAAIVYATVVGLGLLAEALHGRRDPDPREELAGAVDEAVAGVVGGFTPSARRRAEAHLRHAGDVHGAAQARALVDSIAEDDVALPDPVGAVSSFAVRVLHTLIKARFVPWLAVLVLLGSSAFTIARAVTGWWSGDGSPAWVLVGALVAAAASGVLCVVGLLRVGGDAIEGYLWFRRAVIVSLLVTQFFLFRLSQWDASWGLLVDLLVLGLVAAELDALRRRADGEG